MRYLELIKELETLKKDYKIKIIGKTKFNRKIFAVEKIENKHFSTAIFLFGVHARENITCDLAINMLKEKLFNDIKNFNVSFIVMANPDGVELETCGLKVFRKKYHKNLLKMNKNSFDFSMWKANARGVDINNNFDARFGTNVNSNVPGANGFVGKKPESEKETRAIVRYTKKVNPFLTVSYHTKGEEIYFNFFQENKELLRDTKIAERFAKSTGYKIKNVEKVSSGGYKDWCVEKLKIPALTIEVGNDNLSHPISKEFLQDIFDKNKMIATDTEFAYNVFKGKI